MRIAIAVDWSDESFTAVQTTLRLYRPREVVLIHAVDLRPFDNPVFAPAVAKEAFAEFRRAIEHAGAQLLDRTAELLPASTSLRRVLDVGSPAAIVLAASEKAGADLVVLGTRGRGRLSEVALGSVSHRVLVHGTRPTLIVKRGMPACRRVLLPVEGYEDAERLTAWLRAHPFNEPVDLVVLSVVPIPQVMDPTPLPPFEPWDSAAVAAAHTLVHDIAKGLEGPAYRTTARTRRGDPAVMIEHEAAEADLVVMRAHARTAVERFLLGSVSHAVSHRVSCPVLVIRDKEG